MGMVATWGSQRHDERFVQQLGGCPRPVLIDETRESALESVCQGWHNQDQAQSGGEGELKAYVPQGVRIQKRHRDGGRDQGVQGVTLPAIVNRDNVQDTHQRRAHHRCTCPHQYGVENNAGNHRRRGSSAPEEPAGDGSEDAGQNRDVEARNGDDMGCVSPREGVGHVFRDAALDAQQDAGQQRRFRLRKDGLNDGLGPRL